MIGFRMAATLFVQPMDLIKNRMQLSGEGGKTKEHRNTLHAIRSIMVKEGISGMYSGLSAGLLRQATYTTTRLGIYTWLFDTMSRLWFPGHLFYTCVLLTILVFFCLSPDGKPPGFATKAGLGMAAGVVGAFVGTPAEVYFLTLSLATV